MEDVRLYVAGSVEKIKKLYLNSMILHFDQNIVRPAAIFQLFAVLF